MNLKGLIILSFAILAVVGCDTQRKATNSAEETKAETVENSTTSDDSIESGEVYSAGIIRDKSAEGCGFMLEVKADDGAVKLFDPGTLPESFQVEGKTVEVIYHLSRRPSTCALGLPIIIDKIK